MAKVSIKAIARDARAAETKLIKSLPEGRQLGAVSANDSFVNFAQKMGIGADNALSTSSYGFNPITRNHTLLEWIHRGSWLGGVAIDVVADDMTRQGIEYVNEMPPEDTEKLDRCISGLKVWKAINATIKWSRLYGGCIGVMLIDGQDLRTPFRPETVKVGGFKGVLVLDRWMIEAELSDLVTDMGPFLGTPKYYRIGANAPAMRGQVVHYSRVAFRLLGIELPYQQALGENLWGISVIERLYDRMIAFDLASTGAAQLINKAYLRTLTIKGMREIISAGGPAMDGLIRYTEFMRRYQNIEGVTLIDGEDLFDAQAHGAFGGLGDVMDRFANQLSGALQIPLTRLFGQSPGGLNATGDNDMRNYYDHIKQQQEGNLGAGTEMIYRAAAMSEGVKLPDNFGLRFKSLWQLTETDKSDIAKKNAETVQGAYEAGLISAQTTLQELRQASRTTGVFTNITAELIEAADEELKTPMDEGQFDPKTGEPRIDPLAGAGSEGKGKKNGNEPKQPVRSQGSETKVVKSKDRRRVVLPQAPATGA